MKKLLILAGAAAGYVLGTRAGRERYAQIKKGSAKIWNSGPVQTGREEAETAAKQAAAAAGQKVAEAAGTVKDKISSTDDQDVAAGRDQAPASPVPPVRPVATQTGSAPQEGTERP